MRDIIFIVNPRAGTEKKLNLMKQIEFFAKQVNGYRIEILVTKYKNHGSEIASEAVRNKKEIIVAVGGDGTVNEIGASLINTPSVMGIIPCGSGNGLARHFGIPMNSKKALQTLVTGVEKRIDSMLVNKRFSINIAGVGFAAHVAALFSNHGTRGLITYMKLALASFINYKPVVYTIMFNNQLISKKALLVEFANSSQWGNNARIAPQAKPDDGLITMAIVEKLNLSDVPFFIFRLFNGTLHSSKLVQFFQAPAIQVESDFYFPLHIDGESAGDHNSLNLVIQPSSVRLIIPQSHNHE